MDPSTSAFLAVVIVEIVKPIISTSTKGSLELIKSFGCNGEPFDAYMNLRRDTFLTELDKNANNIKISQQIDKNEIIRRSFELTQIIPKTREEKLKYLAHLLQYSISEEEYISADEFDDYLKILDELSVREIQIICLLNDREEKYLQNEEYGESRFEYHLNFSIKFITKIKDKFNLKYDEISAIFHRISRTGCIEPISSGRYMLATEGLDYNGIQYKVTLIFKELAKIAKIKSTDFN